MTIFAGPQIFRKGILVLRGSPAMEACTLLSNHVGMGKFLMGRRLFDMAFGRAVHLVDIGVRDSVQTDMAVFALDLSVNRARVILRVNVIDALFAGLIVTTHVGIAMAQQAVFGIGKYIRL